MPCFSVESLARVAANASSMPDVCAEWTFFFRPQNNVVNHNFSSFHVLSNDLVDVFLDFLKINLINLFLINSVVFKKSFHDGLENFLLGQLHRNVCIL